jgi:hypothetical protein
MNNIEEYPGQGCPIGHSDWLTKTVTESERRTTRVPDDFVIDVPSMWHKFCYKTKWPVTVTSDSAVLTGTAIII